MQYFLGEEQEEVTVEIFRVTDSGEELVDTFVGTKEDEEKSPENPNSFRRGPPPPPTVNAGLNRFEWNLRYPGPTQFEGIIIWNASGARGPKAPPGRYLARVTAGEASSTVPFEVVLDPNLKGITQEHVEEQFALAQKIRNQTSRANEAVIQIRSIRAQLEERDLGASDSDLGSAAEALAESMGTIEEALYQVKNQSGQDPLNFPIRLNNRLSSLRRSVEQGDAKPTDAAYTVYDELSAELEGHLGELEQVLESQLARINQSLGEAGQDAVTAEVAAE